MHKSLVINLSGGLGNQLFQYAAGRSCVEDGSLYLFFCLGVPRSSENGPDILDFDLGKDVKIKILNLSNYIRISQLLCLNFYFINFKISFHVLLLKAVFVR
mgnify:CR=1 FL=1